MKTFNANGKLMLTGEYLVLKGALALAIPVRLGQSMTVRHCEERSDEAIQPESSLLGSGWIASAKGLAMTPNDAILWNAYKPDGLWLSAMFHPESLEILETDDSGKASKLSTILKAVREMNPSAFEPGLHFETHLEFDPSWGLGSSSTLISNLAQWAEVDPYQLLKKTVGGSGYDVACATASTPIFYRLDNGMPQVTPVDFDPPFAEQLYFVYQGQKQHSAKEVAGFNARMQQIDLNGDIEAVTGISRTLPGVTTLEEFQRLIEGHEAILGRCLDRQPVKQRYPDFEGSLKSLGAWGGDFLLAATEWPFEKVKEYFYSKGLDIIFKYQELYGSK